MALFQNIRSSVEMWLCMIKYVMQHKDVTNRSLKKHDLHKAFENEII